MRAVAVFPASREVRLVEHPEPCLRAPGEVRLRMLEVGVCGTDRDLCAFRFGSAPPGEPYFVLGHESLAQVVEAGPDAEGFSGGDLAIVMVRQPCGPPPCGPCAAGRPDFCTTGGYREHGIFGLHGFMTEQVVADRRRLCRAPRELRPVAVLAEPLTIAEKALEQWTAVARRAPRAGGPGTAVVLGAGPVGLLGAMLFRHAGFETWVYSREEESPVARLAALNYVCSREVSPERLAADAGPIDLVYEAMGAPQIAFDVLQHLGPNGLFVFTGVPPAGQPLHLDLHRLIMSMVVRNLAVAGTVNAAPRHFAEAVGHLVEFERRWPGALARMVTGRFPLEAFRDVVFGPPDLKKVIEL